MENGIFMIETLGDIFNQIYRYLFLKEYDMSHL
jgi:hypothetical protein